MDAQHLIHLRAQKDKFFKEHTQSPLTAEQQAKFSGLTYFVAMPKLDLVVDVHEFEKPENVQIQTTTGDTRWYLRWGEFTFTVGNEEARLTIYKMPPDHFFLPFVDTLAGKETYPAGRYLEPELLADGKFRIDFNQAYNPYCAYAPTWNCPITPTENRLKVAIRAGEKLPDDAWAIK
ncbi:MAG: DUF1684 domain-containing protein [Anaerolineae bacterium]|nr:DUF1684 domain-containing protein [Anaerolineae bacterium]MDQ7036210.1 DUF1684 domain-containing protein [Anaerolineae bacterium]